MTLLARYAQNQIPVLINLRDAGGPVGPGLLSEQQAEQPSEPSEQEPSRDEREKYDALGHLIIRSERSGIRLKPAPRTARQDALFTFAMPILQGERPGIMPITFRASDVLWVSEGAVAQAEPRIVSPH